MTEYSRNFKVGDIVTRDGTDRHEILEVGEYGEVKVKCVLAPESGWCKVGEEENNSAQRYTKVTNEKQQGKLFEDIICDKTSTGLPELFERINRAKADLQNRINTEYHWTAFPKSIEQIYKEWFKEWFGEIQP